ncbi:MAG: decaprenyl-phosphate phosphoribosyltransferase [Anaerolineae bacterium]
MFAALLKTMRPRQWTKNVAVFAALVFDEKLFTGSSLIGTLLGFGLLCLVSGTVYIINDVADIEKDKAHPTKKNRPLAAGVIGRRTALSAAGVILLVALPLSFWLDSGFGLLMVVYLLVQVAYSFALKNMVIIDVMTIAAGFVLRVGAGVSLVEVARFSPWLYVCTTLLSLFMGFGKRRQELILTLNGVKNTRATLSDYSINLLDDMIMIVAASTVMAYSLYTFSAPNLPDNHAMMLTIPFVIYGIFRYLYILHISKGNGDPSEVLLQDRPVQVTVMLWGLSAVAILYLS